MSILSRTCALALLAAGLGGCNGIGSALGGGGGVMPETEIGPPPSMRSALPGRQTRSAQVDEDGQALPASPTRTLALPKTVRGETRSADAGPRRIDRDDLEGAGPQGRGSSGGMTPSMTPSGGVGLGGKF